jgi:hypoxanthine phosphoribosyltransferase
MSRKVFYKESTIKGWVHEIIRSMAEDDWRPDYVVGLTRGGLIPANMISQYLDVPMECLKVSLRDDNQCESNTWMAEDAFGYIPEEELKDSGIGGDGAFDYSIRAKKILIVDDINDTGATINWIKKDWPSGCYPDDTEWNQVWGDNVRFAVLTHNFTSEFKDPDYYVWTVNKAEDDCWLVYPWEDFWL